MDDIYKQVIALQDKFRGYVDAPNDPRAVQLRNEIQALENDVQSKKHKFSIEDRIKRVLNIVLNLNDTTVMDFSDKDDLKDRLEELRQEVRKLP